MRQGKKLMPLAGGKDTMAAPPFGSLGYFKDSEEENVGMHDKIQDLLKATQALVGYIEEHHVFDKLADAGCGLYDTYRSDKFEEVVNTAKRVAGELEEELGKAG
jgi:hypothetical protein